MPDNHDSKKPVQPQDGGNGSGNGQDPKGPQPPAQMKMSRTLLSWVMIFALLIVLFFVLNGSGSGTRIESWGEFTRLIDPDDGRVKGDRVIIEDNRVEFTAATTDELVQEGERYWVQIDHQSREFYLNELKEMKVDHESRTGQSVWIQLLITMAPFLIIFLLIWFFIARSMRSAGAGPGGMLGSFGKSRHRVSTKENVDVTFDDVAGVDEAKEEVQEIVEFLKNPKRFQRLGGRIPRGVLLEGAPGCGKTLLAKAIAGEADVPFFSISGSDFVEMFVGVGASRVRDLFKQAKENAPCIIFLDEIDAVGRKRGGGFTTGGHDEREQTLNAILVEMDGFEANDQVIVIAATNRADVLDPALTRPGRFDREVQVPLPDLVGRRQILEVHARKIKTSPNIDLDRIARGTPMFSGADLEAIINESAIIATLANKDWVETSDLEEARDKVKFGRERRSRKIEEDERIATAYHEAGHAVIQSLLDDADPVHKVTIIPRGQYGGATFSLPEKDRYGFGKKYLHATMRVLCGGRIAEERKTDEASSGAAMDIRQVTAYARHMVLDWGMSDRLGFVSYSGQDAREMFAPDKDYSDETARIIDEEIKRIIDEAFNDAKRILDENWDKVVALSEALLKYETLQGEDVKRILAGQPLDKPTVAELLAKEGRKIKSGEDVAAAAAESKDDGPIDDSGGMLPSPA